MEEKTFFFLHSMISSEKVTILVTVFSIQSREKNNAFHIFIVHITNQSLFLNSQFFLSKIIFLYWVVFLLQYLPWLVMNFSQQFGFFLICLYQIFPCQLSVIISIRGRLCSAKSDMLILYTRFTWKILKVQIHFENHRKNWKNIDSQQFEPSM